MDERCIVGAYWGPRPATLGECARGAATTLNLVGTESPLLRRWYLRADRRDDALQRPVRTDVGNLVALLEKGRNVTDIDHRIIEELGFSASAWNGDFDLPASFSVHCGGWVDRVPNSFVIDLPPYVGEGKRIYDVAVARRLIMALIDQWSPDWATFASPSMRVSTQERAKRGPRVGWLTYLSERYGKLPSVAPPGTVEGLPNKGSLILAAPDYSHLSSSDVEHLGTELRAMGVLRAAA